MSALSTVFEKAKKENRAVLIGYLPAGFPTQESSIEIIKAMIEGGVDAIEIGFPYSDPVMDGPTIQEAANTSLNAGTGSKEVFEALAHATSRGIPSVVMTYWNPVEKYGVQEFAASISTNSGSGVITPDLPVDEAQPWKAACAESDINSIFVVAPSTTDQRLEKVTAQCSGFVYAASLMGVTGARTGISSGAKDLVDRIRKVTDTPVAVGLGVSTREHAKEVAAYADGVIVGSAFINALSGADSLDSGIKAVRALVEQLALGVREGRG